MLGVVILFLGISIFGTMPAYQLLSDLVFALIVFGAVVGLPLFAWYGGDLRKGEIGPCSWPWDCGMPYYNWSSHSCSSG